MAQTWCLLSLRRGGYHKEELRSRRSRTRRVARPTRGRAAGAEPGRKVEFVGPVSITTPLFRLPPVPPAADPPTLSSVGGRRLLRRLGAGGMSEVYLAYDADLHCPVAVKVLPDDLAKNATFVGRFRREAEVGQKIDHPNVVRCLEPGQDPQSGRRYLVMEYVKGQSAQTILDREGPIPIADADPRRPRHRPGIEELHHKGYVHRDVKPGNILVAEDGKAKLADLGVAKPLADSAELTSFDSGGRHAVLHALGADAQRQPGRRPQRPVRPGGHVLPPDHRPGAVPRQGRGRGVQAQRRRGVHPGPRDEPGRAAVDRHDPLEAPGADAAGPVPVGRPAHRRADGVRPDERRSSGPPAAETALPPPATRPEITSTRAGGRSGPPRCGRSQYQQEEAIWKRSRARARDVLRMYEDGTLPDEFFLARPGRRRAATSGRSPSSATSAGGPRRSRAGPAAAEGQPVAVLVARPSRRG